MMSFTRQLMDLVHCVCSTDQLRRISAVLLSLSDYASLIGLSTLQLNEDVVR